MFRIFILTYTIIATFFHFVSGKPGKGRLFGLQLSDPEAPEVPIIADYVPKTIVETSPVSPFSWTGSYQQKLQKREMKASKKKRKEIVNAAIRDVPDDWVPVLERHHVEPNTVSGNLVLRCPKGFELTEHGKCRLLVYKNPVVSCPYGSYRNSKQECEQVDSVPPEFVCPALFEVFLRACIRRTRLPPILSCPHGYRQYDEACINSRAIRAKPECPAGYLLTVDGYDSSNVECVKHLSIGPTVECPAGFIPLTSSIIQTLHQIGLSKSVALPLHSDDPISNTPQCIREAEVEPQLTCPDGFFPQLYEQTTTQMLAPEKKKGEEDDVKTMSSTRSITKSSTSPATMVRTPSGRKSVDDVLEEEREKKFEYGKVPESAATAAKSKLKQPTDPQVLESTTTTDTPKWHKQTTTELPIKETSKGTDITTTTSTTTTAATGTTTGGEDITTAKKEQRAPKVKKKSNRRTSLKPSEYHKYLEEVVSDGEEEEEENFQGWEVEKDKMLRDKINIINEISLQFSLDEKNLVENKRERQLDIDGIPGQLEKVEKSNLDETNGTPSGNKTKEGHLNGIAAESLLKKYYCGRQVMLKPATDLDAMDNVGQGISDLDNRRQLLTNDDKVDGGVEITVAKDAERQSRPTRLAIAPIDIRSSIAQGYRVNADEQLPEENDGFIELEVFEVNSKETPEMKCIDRDQESNGNENRNMGVCATDKETPAIEMLKVSPVCSSGYLLSCRKKKWFTNKSKEDHEEVKEEPQSKTSSLAENNVAGNCEKLCRSIEIKPGKWTCAAELKLSTSSTHGPTCEGVERIPPPLKCPIDSHTADERGYCETLFSHPLEKKCPDGFHIGAQETDRKGFASKKLIDWGKTPPIQEIPGLCERVEYAEYQTICPIGYEKAGKGHKNLKVCTTRKIVPPSYICEPGFLEAVDSEGEMCCTKELEAAPTLVKLGDDNSYIDDDHQVGVSRADISVCQFSNNGKSLSCSQQKRFYGDVTEAGLRWGNKFKSRKNES